MYNNSFYGGQKGADIKLVHTFPHLSAANGRGLLDDLSAGFTSNINLGDYVIVAYGKEGNDLYEKNAQIDGLTNWNSSVWEKVFVEKLLPNETYANSNVIGWNYKLITQFTNKYDNALSVKYSYDFYTYGPTSEFNSGVEDTLEAVAVKLQNVHGGKKIDKYFKFNEIQKITPQQGEYYVILDSFTLTEDSRTSYFPNTKGLGWEVDGIYSANIIVTKAVGEEVYQNVTSSFNPIHSNQVIAVNHYYEDGNVSTPIGSIGVSKSENDTSFDVIISNITEAYYNTDRGTNFYPIESNTKINTTEQLFIYNNSKSLIYKLTFSEVNNIINIQVDTFTSSTPKYKSYWYFQRPDGEWGRMLVTGDLDGLIKNEKYLGSDADQKVYSAEYVNNNIPMFYYITLASSNWSINDDNKYQTIELHHTPNKNLCLIFQSQLSEQVMYNHLAAAIEEAKEEETKITFVISKDYNITSNLDLKICIL